MIEKTVIIIIAVAAGMLFLLLVIMVVAIGRRENKTERLLEETERLLKRTMELHIDLCGDIRVLETFAEYIKDYTEGINEDLDSVVKDLAAAVQRFTEMIRQAMGVEGQHEEDDHTIQE